MAPSRKKHARCTARVLPGGFTALSLQVSVDRPGHSLYVKEHRVRDEKSSDRPTDRTLFVLNVPPYCSEALIRVLFSRFGSVQSVELRKRPGSPPEPPGDLDRICRTGATKGFQVGYVVFANASSVSAVKSHPQDVPLVLSTEDRPLRTGLHKWIHQISESFVPADELQAIVDSFMKEYDQRKEEEAELQRREEEEQKEEEEGWVKVTRGHKGAKSRPHSEVANRRTLRREERKKKRKELLNFYSWQQRNSQKEHLAELRKKFEEDKQRIALLRASRKFRPY